MSFFSCVKNVACGTVAETIVAVPLSDTECCTALGSEISRPGQKADKLAGRFT
jgi:hypothetical protein